MQSKSTVGATDDGVRDRQLTGNTSNGKVSASIPLVLDIPVNDPDHSKIQPESTRENTVIEESMITLPDTHYSDMVSVNSQRAHSDEPLTILQEIEQSAEAMEDAHDKHLEGLVEVVPREEEVGASRLVIIEPPDGFIDETEEHEQQPAGSGGKRPKSGQRICYKCRREFPSPEECAAHRTECTAAIKKYNPHIVKALPYVCRRCLTRFPTQAEWNNHRETCKVKRQRVERKCRKCHVIFDDLEALADHRKIHTAEWNKAYVRIKQVHRCDQCEYTCSNEKSLLTHRSLKHNQPLEASDKHPIHRCEVADCSYQTLFLFQLKNHRETHETDRAYICEVCGHGFKQRSVLLVHIRTVHGNFPHACTECGKNLKTKLALKAHIKRVHQLVKNFECLECPFKAFDITSLESHRNSKHNVPYPVDKKSYKCNVCGYLTRWKGQYDAHMRRHTGECPFECKVCLKKFPAKSDLTSHAKWHVDKKNKCPYDKCKFSTCTPSKLKNHIRTVHTHRDEKPFMCHVCDYRSNLRSNLVLHLRKVHKLTVQTKATRVTPVSAVAITPTRQETIPLSATSTSPVQVHPKSSLSRDDTVILSNEGVDNELSIIQQSQVYEQVQCHDQNQGHTQDKFNNQIQGQGQSKIQVQDQVSSQLQGPIQVPGHGQSRVQDQTHNRDQGQLGGFELGPMGGGTASSTEHLLASVKRLERVCRKPVVIQLKHTAGSVMTLQQLQHQLEQVVQLQGVVEGQQYLLDPQQPPQQHVQVLELQLSQHGPQEIQVIDPHLPQQPKQAGLLQQPLQQQIGIEPHHQQQQCIQVIEQQQQQQMQVLESQQPVLNQKLQQQMHAQQQQTSIDPNTIQMQQQNKDNQIINQAQHKVQDLEHHQGGLHYPGTLLHQHGAVQSAAGVIASPVSSVTDVILTQGKTVQQSAGELMAPYASLIQVDIDSLGQSTTEHPGDNAAQAQFMTHDTDTGQARFVTADADTPQVGFITPDTAQARFLTPSTAHAGFVTPDTENAQVGFVTPETPHAGRVPEAAVGLHAQLASLGEPSLDQLQPASQYPLVGCDTTQVGLGRQTLTVPPTQYSQGPVLD